MSNNDVVKKPSHYVEGRKFEPKDVIRDWGLNFNLGNAVKYLARAGRKDDIVQDLKKAQEYIQFEIDAIEAERKKVNPPQHPYCKCATNPYRGKDDRMDALRYGLQEMLDSMARMEELSVKPIVVKLPEGEDPEEIFKGLKRSKPVVEKAESAGSGDAYISLGNLAGMTAHSFVEKYVKPQKVSDLVVTAGNKRYCVDSVQNDFFGGSVVTSRIFLKDKSSGGSVTIILEG